MTDAEQSAAALHEHLWTHLTDGAWHDRCQYCLDRRVRGGTGVPGPVQESA